MLEYICRRFIAIDVEDSVDNCILCKHILCAPALQTNDNNNNNNNNNNFGNELYSIYLSDDW